MARHVMFVSGTRNDTDIEVATSVVGSTVCFEVPTTGRGHQCTFQLDIADLRQTLEDFTVKQPARLARVEQTA